jgi:hypothetical protein
MNKEQWQQRRMENAINRTSRKRYSDEGLVLPPARRLDMTVIGLVACWIPALRAARIDPAISIRAE